MPLATSTLPRPVSISMKFRVSEMAFMEPTGISVVFSHRNLYTWATRRLVT